MHSMGPLNFFYGDKFSGGVMIYIHNQKVNARTVLNQFWKCLDVFDQLNH